MAWVAVALVMEENWAEVRMVLEKEVAGTVVAALVVGERARALAAKVAAVKDLAKEVREEVAVTDRVQMVTARPEVAVAAAADRAVAVSDLGAMVARAVETVLETAEVVVE